MFLRKTEQIKLFRIPVQEPLAVNDITNRIELPFLSRKQKIEKMRIAKRFGIAALTISIITGTALTLTSCDNKNDQVVTGLNSTNPATEYSKGLEIVETMNGTTATIKDLSDVTVSETVKNPEGTIDYSMPPVDVAEGYSFDSILNADQQLEIRKLNEMSSEVFQTLSLDEQLAFATWIFDNNRPNFELVMGKNDINLKYVDNPTTAEEIIGNYAYLSSFQVSLFEYSADKGMAYDFDSTKKLNVLKMTPTEVHTKGQNAYMDSFANNIPTVFDYNMTVEGYKKIENGFIINVYEQSTKNITVNPGKEHNQLTFVSTKFTDIQGNERDMYICSLNIPASDPGYIEGLTNN